MKYVINKGGYTIVELMVATAIFSVILLLCATAMINIGNTYHKGIISSQTQDATRTITDELSSQVKFGGKTPVSGLAQTYGGLTVRSFCIGEKRYSYALDTQVTDGLSSGTYVSAKKQALHAMWRDTALDPVSCPPANLTQTDPSSNTGTVTLPGPVQVNGNGVAGSGIEMIPLQTRLAAFSLTNVQASLWKLQIKLAFGDEDLLVRSGGHITGCVASNKGGNFCAISDLSTEVYRAL
jgi:prepilin-type N-terminal cleavage/methylation domain-containing protein